MYDLSPEARKAQQNANARRNGRQSFFDGGPVLSDDGAEIMIPSPAPHAELARVLRAYGFRFENHDAPGPLWTRPTSRPHQGWRYTPAGWLAWARQTYAKAWPNWKEN